MDSLFEKLDGWGPLILDALTALVVLVVGWIVAATVGRIARKKLTSHPNVDATIGGFVASVLRRWRLASRSRARSPISRRASC